ncbi:MAG: chemotaxis protein CheX [Magnetococcus sp. DMHC-6]
MLNLNVVTLSPTQQKLVHSLEIAIGQLMDSENVVGVVFSGLEEMSQFVLQGELNGIVHLSGQISAIIGLSMSQNLGRELIAQMTGLSADMLEKEDMMDGVAELVNIVCGAMKSNAQFGPIVLTTPVAILGGEITAVWKTTLPTLKLTFEIQEEILNILLYIEDEKKPRNVD